MKWLNNKSISVRDLILVFLGMFTVISLLLLGITLMKLFFTLFKICFICLLWYAVIYLIMRTIRNDKKK